VPQIALICGPCAGGAAYSPALTDFIIQTRQAQMFITGPQVIKQVTGEQITAEALGGPDAHMGQSGVIHFIAENDEEALHLCRRLLSFLPSNNLEDPPRLPAENDVDPNPELASLVPIEGKQGYDMRRVIGGVVDRGDFLEVQAGHAPNMVVGFARILGRSVGIIANQPSVLSGAIDHRLDQGRPVHPFLQRLQHPADHVRGRAGVPARRPAGARRHHPPRRKLLFASRRRQCRRSR
jgi:methylmalonyl-CoA carboxyltransferase large subunit